MNWKAIVAGILTIAVLGLAAQFAFLLTATWLVVQKNHGIIHPDSVQMLNYTAGFLFAMLALVPGGYVTANISKIRVLAHCTIVGSLATFISLVTSMGIEHTTGKGIIFLIFGTVLTIFGGVIWSWRNKKSPGS